MNPEQDDIYWALVELGTISPVTQPSKPTTPTPELPAAAPDTDEARAYARAALRHETANVRFALEGTRNHTLNTAAYNMGQLVAGGYIGKDEVLDALTTAAEENGLGHGEINNTAPRAMSDGARKPRVVQLDPKDHKPTAPEDDNRWAVTHDQEEGFWHERDHLLDIRQFARARIVSPWAVLGAVLVRVVCATEPTLVLPPITGGEMSLNLFIALTGASGTGKDAAQAVAAEAVDLGYQKLDPITPGSGEGIGHAFAHRKGNESPLHTSRVLFAIAEIDTFAALSARRGATLTAVLRDCFGGAPLGFQYADATKRLSVPSHSYRMGLLAGVQPGRAGALLDDADGGTPQRFVWVPTTDPDAPDKPDPEPEPVKWQSAEEYLREPAAKENVQGYAENIHMQVCDLAREEIIENRRATVRGRQADPLDGHLLLTRLKVAAALAILDGRIDVTEKDWAMSRIVIGVSNRTRSEVIEYRKAEARKANDKVGEKQAYRELAAEEARDRARQAAVERVAKLLPTKMPSDGEWIGKAALARKVNSRDRKYVDEALELLADARQIEVDEDGRGTKFRPAM